MTGYSRDEMRPGLDHPPPAYETLEHREFPAHMAATPVIQARPTSPDMAPRTTARAPDDDDAAPVMIGNVTHRVDSISDPLTTELVRVIRDKKTISLVSLRAPGPAIMTVTLKSAISLSQPDMIFVRGPAAAAGAADHASTDYDGCRVDDARDAGDAITAAPRSTILGKAVFHDISTSKADVTIGGSEFRMKKTYASLTGLGWCRWGRDDEKQGSSRNFYLMAHCTVTEKGKARIVKRTHKKELQRRRKKNNSTYTATKENSDSEDDDAGNNGRSLPTRDDLTGGVRIAEYRSSDSMGGVRARQTLAARGFKAGIRHVTKAAVGDYREDRVAILVDGLSAEQRDEVLITAVVERERRKRADDEAGSVVQEVLMGVLI
ncbi:hypothetical protein MN608_10908 [Microdochium nivale]|nr:hypothetical protein MN608_10908 [Microdochium nivale]